MSDVPESVDGIIELLIDAGEMPQRPRALLAAADEDPRAAKLPILRRLMEFTLHHDEPAYLARTRELAFLANSLLAGCSVQSRPFTPQEASDAAACVCNLGLESGPTPADAFLVDHDLVTSFEAGWSALYRDVSLMATDQLISTLDDLNPWTPTLARSSARCGAHWSSTARPVRHGSRAKRLKSSRYSTRLPGSPCSGCWTNAPSCRRRSPPFWSAARRR
jgi:hypothetical protein